MTFGVRPSTIANPVTSAEVDERQLNANAEAASIGTVNALFQPRNWIASDEPFESSNSCPASNDAWCFRLTGPSAIEVVVGLQAAMANQLQSKKSDFFRLTRISGLQELCRVRIAHQFSQGEILCPPFTCRLLKDSICSWLRTGIMAAITAFTAFDSQAALLEYG